MKFIRSFENFTGRPTFFQLRQKTVGNDRIFQNTLLLEKKQVFCYYNMRICWCVPESNVKNMTARRIRTHYLRAS